MQSINGDNNIQAGGNVIVNKQPAFSPNNPNAVKCPQCGTTTDRHSVYCQGCTYQVKAHHDQLDLEAKQRKLQLISLITVGVSSAILYVAQHWLTHNSIQIGFMVAGMGGYGIAALLFKASNQ